MKSIQVDGDVYAFLVGHGMGPGQSASDVLRQTLFRAVEIDDDLYAYTLVVGVCSGEMANAILRRELAIHANPPPVDPLSHVEFHIPAGTGPGPSKSRDHPVRGWWDKRCEFTTISRRIALSVS